jgi:hypothetical protein
VNNDRKSTRIGAGLADLLYGKSKLALKKRKARTWPPDHVLLDCLQWILPNGKFWADKYRAVNTRAGTRRAGSFSCDIRKRQWVDFTTGKWGKGLVHLAAYVFGVPYEDARKQIALWLKARGIR